MSKIGKRPNGPEIGDSFHLPASTIQRGLVRMITVDEDIDDLVLEIEESMQGPPSHKRYPLMFEDITAVLRVNDEHGHVQFWATTDRKPRSDDAVYTRVR